ncbi:MAG: hypothetical protein EPN70_21495 [Paraburkholderia sp.]|uniref:hypothetical protein n=1 Tax=Paraburkholderia sp. TaxID=1926495 RepID=UPI0011FEA362|nr:hypothetical protein [Paraburkholderia sp.]TAM00807.1 MAG: hypothetical protein EPN70_21495 [Paraburkholderia sp.]
MSLSEQLTDAIAAQNALTQAVAGKMGQIDGRVEQFISQWGIDGYTTLEVGAGKPFDSIPAAWDSLIGKVLKADVLIKVADGVHTTTGFTLHSQPFAHRVRIEGNIGNPAACQIKFTPDGGGASHGVIFDNVRNVTFSGFKLIGDATDQNWTHRSLLIVQGSRVWSAPGSVQIEGGGMGLVVEHGSQYECSNLHISNTRQWGALIGSGARASLPSLRLAGPGKDVRTTLPARIFGTESTTVPHGLAAIDTAQCWAGEAHITGCWHGAHAVQNGYLWCDLVKIEHCGNGCYAAAGGVVWSHWSPVAPGNPVEKRSRIVDAVNGFFADIGGKIIAPGAIVEQCENGFFAAQQALIHAVDSIAHNCTTGYSSHGQSTVLAYGANPSECTTNFTPPNSDVPGNGNAIIRR